MIQQHEPKTPQSQAFQQMMMQIYGPQQVTPFTGDWSTYGQSAGEHQFFRPGPAAPGGGALPSPGLPPPSPVGGAGPSGLSPSPMPAGLTGKQILQRLRQESQGTGQKLTKSDRRAIRHLSTDPDVRNTQIIDMLDRGLGWVQDPLGGLLGMVGMENPLGMSNFGATGILAGAGRKALGAGRDVITNRIVDRNRAGTPAERERENWNDRVREAQRTGGRIGGPV